MLTRRIKAARTPLLAAVINRRYDVAKLLLANKADVNTTNNTGETPVHAAEINGQEDMAEMLRQYGANDPSNEIHDAAASGDLEKVKALLKDNPDLVFSKDTIASSFLDGGTALHLASFNDHKDVAELLLANHANVNATNKFGWTPLHVAARYNHKDMAEFTAGKQRLMSMPKAYGNITPLHFAVMFANKDVTELLLASNADVNAKNKDGYTPLRLAVQNGHIDVVELLLAYKADLDTRDHFGETLLHAAAGTDHADVAKLLLANKADVNAATIFGQTPLSVAVWHGYKDMVELLLASNADVNAKESGGDTPFQIAIEYGHADVAELLRQHRGHGIVNTNEPLVGWYSDGDTGVTDGGYQACIEKIPYGNAISNDVRNFVEKLPMVKSPFGFIPSRSENYWITQMSFFVDGTGQHAIKIDDIPIEGTYQNYVLIYNKSDVRIKVIKFSSGHYQD